MTDTIRRVAAERLADARIVKVDVREVEAFDGDPIFVVTLVRPSMKDRRAFFAPVLFKYRP